MERRSEGGDIESTAPLGSEPGNPGRAAKVIAQYWQKEIAERRLTEQGSVLQAEAHGEPLAESVQEARVSVVPCSRGRMVTTPTQQTSLVVFGFPTARST